MSSCWVDSFIIIQCPSLSLTIVFALNSILSDVSIGPLAVFWLFYLFFSLFAVFCLFLANTLFTKVGKRWVNFLLGRSQGLCSLGI